MRSSKVAAAAAPWKDFGPTNALDMWNERQTSAKLTTGCPHIDACLGGGILTGGITDLCGEASAGKSQFCMQVALHSLLPRSHGGLDDTEGRETSCLYICTEGRFPSKRFVQMATSFQAKHSAVIGDPRNQGERLLDRVLISELLEPEDFWPFVQKDLPILVKVRRVKCIVVDSVTGICRGELAGTRAGVFQRSQWLLTFAEILRKIAGNHGATILTVNQVSALFEDEGGLRGRGAAGTMEHRSLYPFPPRVARVKPALGLLWSTSVNSRIMLHRSQATRGEVSYLPVPKATGLQAVSNSSSAGEQHGPGEEGFGHGSCGAGPQAPEVTDTSEHKRYVRLIMSPAFPTNIVCPYVISSAGVQADSV